MERRQQDPRRHRGLLLRFFLNLILLSAASSALVAQGTFTAIDCNYASVNNLVNGPLHTAVNGDIILIPAGSCNWGVNQLIVPDSIGIQIKGLGTPNTQTNQTGASSSCSQTVITPGTNGTLIQMTPTLGNSLSRISCMKIGAPASTNLQPFFIQGHCNSNGCPDFRVDNVTIPSAWTGVGPEGVFAVTDVFGVADHNSIGDTVQTGIGLDFLNVAYGHWAGVGNYGDNSWASADTLGTIQAFYLENNAFIGAFGTDMDIFGTDWGGGRAVCRFNTFNTVTAASACTNHGTDTAGRTRSGRQLEVYRNTMVGDTNTAAVEAVRGGILYIFDNIMTGTANSFFALSVQRPWRMLTPFGQCTGEAGNSSWDQVDTTVSLGPFTVSNVNSSTLTITFTGGTLSINAAAAVTAGKPYAAWDTNKLLGTTNPPNLHAGSQILSNTSTTITVIDVCDASLPNDVWCPAVNDSLTIGKVNVCMDQTTRGQGLLVTGDTPVLSSTSNPGSVAEALDPTYIAGNSTGTLTANYGGGDPGIIANRDFYTETANQGAQTSPTSPFDGTTTTSMGHGIRSRRPPTCTPSVGYWATDVGTWNHSGSGNQGQLFICTAPNVWTLSYEPLRYPHPLVGTGVDSPPPPGNVGIIGLDSGAAQFVTSTGLGPQQSATWTSATAQNATLIQPTSLTPTVLVGFNPSGTISGGGVTFEVTSAPDGNSNWQQATCFRTAAMPQMDGTYTLTNINQYWQCPAVGASYFRMRLSTVITGSGIANMTIQGSSGVPSVGAMVAEKAVRTPTSSQPAVSTVASATLPAGAAGVSHVADCVSFNAMNTTALAAAAQLQVNLRDGASGAGAVLWSQQLFAPIGPGQASAPPPVCGLGLRGSTATPMTLEFSGAVTNLFENVTLTTYDVQ